MDNVDLYYNPEKVGFNSIFTLEDPDAYYSFDTVIVVQENKTGRLYAAHDSGCSCPTPFERCSFPTDYTEIRSVDDFTDFLGSHPIYSQRDIDAAVEAIKKAL